GLLKNQPFPTHLVGAAAMISDVFAHLDQDASLLTAVSSIVMTLVIALLYRSVRWMLLPLLIVAASLVWTQALTAILQLQVSLVGSMTTALVTVIGIATVIHVATRFHEESEGDADPESALRRTLNRLLAPVFWTVATTAVGFAALGVTDVAPVRNYAILMAAASMLSGLAVVVFLPGGALMGKWGRVPQSAPGEELLESGLDESAHWVARHSVKATLALAAFMAAAAVGFKDLRVETDFTKNFRDDSPLLVGYRNVERKLGGAGVVELTFDAPKRLDDDFVEKVRRCAKELAALPGVTKVSALHDFLDFFADAVPTAPDALTALLPARSRETDQLSLDLQLAAMRLAQPEAVRGFWNPESGRMRLVLRVREQQTVDGKERLLAEVRATAEKVLDRPVETTGLYVLLVHLIANLLGDQWTSFLTSAAGILAMTTMAFRSFRMGFVAFIPNIVPIVVTVGVMGWLGIALNVATAMITSISMGLVVDFSLHYLHRFEAERSEGKDFYAALFKTHRSAGKGMVFANVALMLGFGVLMFSQFVPTVQFGLLVGIAILGGLLGNLILLPVLLRLFLGVGRPRNEK
ncbi:MAG: efflux RND transporter permease subunit, partial [Planctomycetia bacterium]